MRYSRAQEYQADDLGLAYLHKAGLDPYEAAEMLEALGRNEQHLARTRGADAARSIPEWARTHPLSGNRAGRARTAAAAMGLKDDELPENRGRYLAAVDGLLFGDDPPQGFVSGRIFAHPMMRIAFAAPTGFTLTNSPQAILIEGPGGMRGQFAAGPLPEGGLAAYSQAVLGQLLEGARVEVVASQPARINGLDALVSEVRVASGGQQVALTMAAYAAGPSAFHFVMLSEAGKPLPPALGQLFESFRLISADEAQRLRARVIDVVEVRPGDTARTLAERMASANPLADFLMLNARGEDSALRPGEPVKLIVFGSP